MRSKREEAARALCRLEGHPPDIKFEGAPMWRSYLPQVDAVLKAALPGGEFDRLMREGAAEPVRDGEEILSADLGITKEPDA